MNATSIIHLRDTGQILTRPCGGKANGLAKLFAAGVEVPEGVVILADIQHEMICESLLTWVRERIVSSPLMTTHFAVRSSAMCEDGQAVSFAGMFETFLDVLPDEVPAKVLECQRSARNIRARSYANANGIAMGDIAVVIQEMLKPTAAGVCFTANPVNHNTQEIMIEAISGTGDKLVSGVVTPDCWILDNECNVLDKQCGDECPTGMPSLQNHEVRTLAFKAIELQRNFGHPLDIEFAFAMNRLFFLQARPITTLGIAA